MFVVDRRNDVENLSQKFYSEKYSDRRSYALFDLVEISTKFSPRNIRSFCRGWLSFQIKWLLQRGGGGTVCHGGRGISIPRV